jgi:cell division protein FtsB
MLQRAKSTLAALSPQQRLVLGALVASVAMVFISLADPKGLRRLERLRFDIDRQEQKNRELREENARLSRTVKELSPPVSAAALEKAAREQLGFVRPDELLFKFE